MKAFLKILTKKLETEFSSLAREYIREKYNSKSDICVVSAGLHDEYLIGETSRTTKRVSLDRYNDIRHYVGENVLTMYGPILDEKAEVPRMTLFVTPSAIKALGLSRAYRLIKDWPGESTIPGGYKVVEYSLF